MPLVIQIFALSSLRKGSHANTNSTSSRMTNTANLIDTICLVRARVSVKAAEKMPLSENNGASRYFCIDYIRAKLEPLILSVSDAL